MNNLLPLIGIFPLIVFFISLVIPARNERWISTLSISAAALHLAGVVVMILYWAIHPDATEFFKGPLLYATESIHFYFSFLFDKVSAVFLGVGSILTFLVITYSRLYMHREKGYKRFFSTVLFFYAGYCLVVLSGNFEVLFAGWEILGISSFLLISFYRERYLPVKNAFKVFSIYRLSDVGLVLAAWMCHIIWHHNIQFNEWKTLMASDHSLSTGGITFLGFLLLLSAMAKSAQFPFSSWLPRAMEGPTPSSAIFYGSLSIHMGVFVLLRTQAIWEQSIYVEAAMVLVGLITAFICAGIAKAQSTIKTQIAYSSLTQIGLIFVELALGFENLALLHFTGNAFLRTYQLLVSPSIVSYLIREQSYTTGLRSEGVLSLLPQSLKKALYILSVKEWNMDYFLEELLWRPIKKAGDAARFFITPFGVALFVLILAGGWTFVNTTTHDPSFVIELVSILMSVIGLFMVLLSFSERIHARTAWTLVFANHVWITAAVSTSDKLSWEEIAIYLSGAFVSWIIGTALLMRLKKQEPDLSLRSFQGHAYAHPLTAFAFLICCLGLSGFPITPTFIGEDVIFHHIHDDQFFVALCAALSYIIDGLAIVRIYTRVFMGPHIRTTHEVSNRSA